MKRLFAILLLAAAGLFAACNNPAATPGVTTEPLPTETPVEPSLEPTPVP